jgi:hypothetical protein
VLALLAEDPAQRPAGLALLTETSVGSMNSRLNRLVREGKRVRVANCSKTAPRIEPMRETKQRPAPLAAT